MGEQLPQIRVPTWIWAVAAGLVGTGAGSGITITRNIESAANCADLEQAAAACAAVVDLLIGELAECRGEPERP